ncbi:MAG: transporter substrate-binding domain-containing protein [Desulfuromonadaceae bacterium]|nr:transporter substrate-binding domain-containing protein [Desulfuromonadaceae bacterium]
MNKMLTAVATMATICLLKGGIAEATPYEYNYVAEDAAPQNYLEQGVLKGYAAELIMAIWNRMGIKPKKIRFLPWDKAYQLALTQPKTILLTTARLDEREALFKWVGPINTPRFSLFADSARNIKISGIEEARKYRVCTVINDAAEMLLLNRKFPKERLDRSHDVKTALGRIQERKCELFAYSEASMKHSLKLFGLDAARYVNVFPIAGSPVFFAFHRDTQDSAVKEFQDALNALKKDGTYKKIKEKYGFSD